MPETTVNGYSNGNHIHNGYEMEDNASFLFTSESVGEGHPGEFISDSILRHFMANGKEEEEEKVRRKRSQNKS